MPTFEKNDCSILVTEDKKIVKAWIKGLSFFIRPNEKDMFRFNPDQALGFLMHKMNKNIFRCSECGWEGHRDEFKNGHMASLLCVACHGDYVATCESERKSGNVCRICKRPRSSCVC